MKPQARNFPTAIALVSLLGLTACIESQAVDQPETTQSLPPQVSVVTLQPSSRPFVRELPGRIAPTRMAEVRARISGIVVERSFKQGADVKAGDVLYRIDPEPFQVELAATQAALAKAQAVLEQAEPQAKRVERLMSGQTASQAQYETAIATWRQAQADVAARKADVARAKLNLDYTQVRAPISGRVGRALLTEGALVGQGEATHLATVQQLHPIYADFTQSVNEMQQLRREIESGSLEQVAAEAATVRLVLADGTIYPHAGKLLFSEASVDPSTGQVTLRGEFPNPKTELLPGTYVRVQIVQGIDGDALTVPEQAIRRNDAGDSELYVVGADNRAVVRPVRVGDVVDDQWRVLAGVQPGDRVVVEGFQKFSPGDLVHPVAWEQKRTTTAAAGPGLEPAPIGASTPISTR